MLWAFTFDNLLSDQKGKCAKRWTLIKWILDGLDANFDALNAYDDERQMHWMTLVMDILLCWTFFSIASGSNSIGELQAAPHTVREELDPCSFEFTTCTCEANLWWESTWRRPRRILRCVLPAQMQCNWCVMAHNCRFNKHQMHTSSHEDATANWPKHLAIHSWSAKLRDQFLGKMSGSRLKFASSITYVIIIGHQCCTLQTSLPPLFWSLVKV